MSLLLALLMSQAPASLPAQADNYPVGAKFLPGLCKKERSYTDLYPITRSVRLRMPLELYALTCSGEGEIVVLKKSNVDESGQIFEVVSKINRNAPESLFFEEHSRAPLLGAPLSYSFETVFFVDTTPDSRRTCRLSGGRIAYQQITSVFKPSHGFKLEPIKTFDICLPFNAHSPTAQFAHLDILDAVVDYRTGYPTRLLIRESHSVFSVLAIDIAKGEAQVIASFDGNSGSKPHFTAECGKYLIGAKLLPGSEKVGLFFKNPKVVIADFSDRSNVELREVYNQEGGEATCEGFMADYSSLGDQVVIDAKSKLISFLAYILKGQVPKREIVEIAY